MHLRTSQPSGHQLLVYGCLLQLSNGCKGLCQSDDEISPGKEGCEADVTRRLRLIDREIIHRVTGSTPSGMVGSASGKSVFETLITLKYASPYIYEAFVLWPAAQDMPEAYLGKAMSSDLLYEHVGPV